MRYLYFIIAYYYRLKRYISHFIKERSIIRKLGTVSDLVDNDLVKCDADEIDPHTLPIYVLWWQGEDNMPEIVQACYRNLKRKAGVHPVYLITQDNLKNFINESDGHWDKIILDKVNAGTLKLAQFADILRMYLTGFTHNGGIWIDATVYVTANSVDDFIAIPFSSGRRSHNDANNWNASRCRWTSFYFTAIQGNPLSQFIYNSLVKLLYVDGNIAEYFTIDYLFNYAYWHISGVKEMVNSSPIFKNAFHAYDGNGTHQIFSKDTFSSVCEKTPFLKLTYRCDCQKYIDGRLTIYGYLTSI
jgi:hypothetical protein